MIIKSDKVQKIYSGHNSNKNLPLSKIISQKFQNFSNLSVYPNKDSNNRNFRFKTASERNIRKEQLSSENNKNFALISKFNSKSNLSNNKNRISLSEYSSKKYQNDRRNSSSIIRTSEIESNKSDNKSSNNISNSNSNTSSNNESNTNEEMKVKTNIISEKKMSLNNNNINNENNINENNSNFSRIEEVESSDSKNENSESDSCSHGWSRKFKNQVFERFKTMVKIINQKKKNDYNSIILAIQGNEDDKILHVLTDADFKYFYRNKDNLFEKDVFMDEMIKYKKFDLLKKVSQDPSYEFDKDYIFNCLFYCISPKLNEDKKQKLNKTKTKKNIICYSFNYEFFNNTLNVSESLDRFLKMKPRKNFKNISDNTMLEIIAGLVENQKNKNNFLVYDFIRLE